MRKQQVNVVREADQQITHRCDTVSEAESFIAGMLHTAPPLIKGVIEDGGYGIVAPEELVNPKGGR